MEAQWAAELATHLIRIDNGDCKVRSLKAEAFNLLATQVTNPNWRYWYQGAVQELHCPSLIPPVYPRPLINPYIVQSLPAATWVESWTTRLLAEKTQPKNLADSPGVQETLGFWYLPPNQVTIHLLWFI